MLNLVELRTGVSEFFYQSHINSRFNVSLILVTAIRIDVFKHIYGFKVSTISHLFFHTVQCNEETGLIKDLFKNYNKNIRPVVQPEDKVTVQIKLTLTNLISLVSPHFPHSLQQSLIITAHNNKYA